MNSNLFLRELQKKAEGFHLRQLHVQVSNERADLSQNSSTISGTALLSIENALTMIRLKQQEHVEDFELDDAQIDSITCLLEEYMDQYASGQKKLKQYIVLISLYLFFIEEKPFHPLGMQMEDGRKLVFDGLFFRCPLKHKYAHDRKSLCSYCKAKTCLP